MKLTDEEARLKAIILTVPVRFRDNPNGGIMDELPVYMPEHQAENIARAIAAAQSPTCLLTEGQDEVAEHIDIMRRYIYESAVRFRMYETSHRSKKTPEGDEKAKRNQEMADQGEWALGSADALLRILKSQVPQAPVVDEAALEKWLHNYLDGWGYPPLDAEINRKEVIADLFASGLLRPAPTWQTLETAPKNVDVLVLIGGVVVEARMRYGNLGEPQQDVYAWRAKCCGHFGTPTHWRPKPSLPSSAGG